MNFTDISCVVNKLKIKQKLLEKNSWEFMRNVSENYGIVLDDDNIVLKAQNEHQMVSLQKDVQENKKILQELRNIVSPENIPKIDLLALKHKMLALENSIENVKDSISNNMNDLTKEENDLSIEVTNLEIKYSDLNRNKYETHKIPLTTTHKKENISVYQEVEDFANFVNHNGGHEGGWSQNDHLLFLKYYQQTKSRKQLYKILSRFLPDFSEEKILNHFDWYEKYISLRERQKNALDEWRKHKHQTKKCHVDARSSSSEEKKKAYETERQNIKDKIHKWKIEKQQKQKEEHERRLKNETNLQKYAENRKRFERGKKNDRKTDVGKWRASKQAQERADQLEKEVLSLKEKERKIMIANALIREFQKQDSLYIMRRIHQHNLKTESFVNAHPRKDTHKEKKCRDPERIFKATRQWLSRIACEDRTHSMFDKKPLGVQQIPKLGVPTWRLAAK